MAVFPEQMDRLDVNDPAGSLQRIENYIRYMTERVEFSNRNTTRTVTEAGVSTVGLYNAVVTLTDAVAVLQSNLSILSGNMNAFSTSMSKLNEDVAALNTKVAAIETSIRELTTRVETLEGGTEA